jgi:hypothetical protein
MTAIVLNTAERVVIQAMRNAKLLQKGQYPDSEDYAEYFPMLIDLINARQTMGLKLWLQTDVPVPMTVGVAQYLLGPGGIILPVKPTRISEDGYYVEPGPGGASRPVFMVGSQEWYQLSSRNSVTLGPVTQFYADKQQNNIVLNIWLTPDAQAVTGSLHMIVQQQVTTPIQTTDGLNFPQEWFIALHWGLADEICGGQPAQIQERCQQRAALYWQMLEDWDVEDAGTRFIPDFRGMSGASQFTGRG